MLIHTKEGHRPTYEILKDYERFPVEVDKTFADNALAHLEKDLKDLNEVLKAIYEQEPDLYWILSERLDYFKPFSAEPDSYESFSSMADEVKKVAEELRVGNDTIPTYEETVLLTDLGFKNPTSFDEWWFEKILEDTDEKEVAEEVFLRDEIRHRKRTIHWEKTDYGRSSKEIIYEDLETDEELSNAIKNTKRELGK